MTLDDGADRSNRSSLGRLEPPAIGVTGDEPAHGTNGAPNLRSDVPSRQSMGWPTGREPHGHGVSVVIRAGESPAHGEGRQVTRCHGTGGTRDARRRNDPWHHPRARPTTAAARGRLSPTVQPSPVPALLRPTLSKRWGHDERGDGRDRGRDVARENQRDHRAGSPRELSLVPVRRVYIPKPKGGGSRPLGIPTWSD